VITTVIRNEGNAGLWPEGSFAIVDEMETVWGTVGIQDYVIQPGSSGRISEEWEGILLPQRYELTSTINIVSGHNFSTKRFYSINTCSAFLSQNNFTTEI